MRGLFSEISAHVGLKKWPFVAGVNMQNGFFHVVDNAYVKSPHAPQFWQKNICELTIEDELLPMPSEHCLRFFLDFTERK